MRLLIIVPVLVLLQLACARTVPPPKLAPGHATDGLTGTVWWRHPGEPGRCLDWTFVSQGPGSVRLEHREVEETDDWSREVVTSYSMVESAEGTMMYAPGYEYRWLREPGPESGLPPMRGAMGHYDYFCVLGDDGRVIEWSQVPCGSSGAPVQRWYRSRAECDKVPVEATED